MTICKTLSLALIALSFGACAGTNATHSTATDVTHSATMDMESVRFRGVMFGGRYSRL